MKKAKRSLLYLLSIVFVVSMTFVATSFLTLSASAKVIKPYNPSHTFTLTGVYDNGGTTDVKTDDEIDLSVNYVENYTYQFWVKAKVSTDTGHGSAISQYIWQLIGGGVYNGTTGYQEVSLSLADYDCADDNGNYNIIVRIKDASGNVIEELYKTLSPTDVNELCITNISVSNSNLGSDKVVINKEDALDIIVYSNLTNVTYSLYYGITPIAVSNTTGIFNAVSVSGLQAGDNIITVQAGKDGSIVNKYIQVYVYDTYTANERPVITSLIGSTEDGNTTFWMYVRYADGTSIELANAGNYSFSLVSGGKICIAGTAVAQINDATLIDYIPFTVNYGSGKYGIYYTVGKVARSTVNGYDDEIIQYYSGYARPATLEQNSTNDNGTYTITASGHIELTQNEIGENKNYVAGTDLRYAFYREDASGWVLIKDYPKDGTSGNTLTWIPQKTGSYNIQVRIKDANASFYEAAVTKTYIIAGVQLDDNLLNIELLDYNTRLPAELYEAGKPYILSAEYNGGGSVLYMYTITNQNLGTVYLNKYSPSNTLMFIPNKADTYIFTVRIIGNDDYGFKNISSQLSVTTAIKIEASYKVEHYYQNIEDDNFTLNETQNLIGTANTTAIAIPKSDAGFTEDTENGNRVLSGKIVEDGSLILKLYYTRNSYSVELINSSAVLKTLNIKYGGTLTKADRYISQTEIVYEFRQNGSEYSMSTPITESLDIDVVLYDSVIYTVTQFQNIFMRKTSPTDGLSPTAGNYILMADMNFAGVANNTSLEGLYAFCGVAGVLEGNGYSMKNIYIRRHIGEATSGNALFWNVSGTIRNMSFENIIFNGLTGATKNGVSTTMVCSSGLIVENFSGKLENISLQGTMLGWANATLWGTTYGTFKSGFAVQNATGSATINNIIIDVDNNYRHDWETDITRVIGAGSVVATNVYVKLPAHAGFGSSGNTVTNYVSNNSLDALAANMQSNLPSDVWSTNGTTAATLRNGCIVTAS